MLYDYTCSKCNVIWEEQHPIDERDINVGKPTPKQYCSNSEKCNGAIERLMTAPALTFEGSVGTIRRAGSEWNDVLKGIKKASGKDNTIEHY